MNEDLTSPPEMREGECPFCEHRVLVYEEPPRCPLCSCPLEERPIAIETFRSAEAIALVSSVRGWRDAELVP